jgi:hypothetical protein
MTMTSVKSVSTSASTAVSSRGRSSPPGDSSKSARALLALARADVPDHSSVLSPNSYITYDSLRGAVRVAVRVLQAVRKAQRLAVDRDRARRPLLNRPRSDGTDAGRGERGGRDGEDGEDGGELHRDVEGGRGVVRRRGRCR